MVNSPDVHYWLAGDEMNAVRANEIKAQIDWLRNPPMVHVTRLSTAQTLTGNWNIISFDTLVNSYDPYEMWDIGTPDVITAQVAGWYYVLTRFALNATATEARLQMGVFKNGTDSLTNIEMRSDNQNTPSQGSNTHSKAFHVYCNKGDVLRMGVGIENDASRTTTIASLSDSCIMMVRWCSK